ncbi:ShlB/FhaC/HecB family hemolysin secretion/activation protein [Xanthobacteraceae bacterium A53D]
MRRNFMSWGLAALLSAAGSTASLAQAIPPVERNLPPVISGQGRLMIGPQDLAGSADGTPLGVDIRAISLVGAQEDVGAAPSRGIRIGAIGAGPRAALKTALAPFIGQPLSRRTMAEIQAAIAKAYREEGYPFVSVTLPPQEVTSGGLALRVLEFRSGKVNVKGAEPGMEADIAARVRAAPGGRISADALDEDLAWLNRYPYRSVTGVFSPGDELGISVLNLEVTAEKPWQVFGGWSNTGTHATGFDRYFLGFGAAVVGLPQSFMSYQVTGSPNFWTDPGSVGIGPDQPSYYSHSGRFSVATGARQGIEVVPSYVATRQKDAQGLFAYTNVTLEVPVTYRTAVSNLLPGVHAGDLLLGVTGKYVSRRSYFDGYSIGGASADLFEIIAGWSFSKADPMGQTSFEAKLIANPGGVLGGNSVARWEAFSGGRVSDLTYVYGVVDATRVTRLEHGFSWVTQFTSQAAGQPLPDTEQISLGGMYAVRGYSLDDGSADAGFVWRNEMRAPGFAVAPAFGITGASDQLSPYAFLDVGWGWSYGYRGPFWMVEHQEHTLAGMGIGFDYTLGRNLTASLVAGVALTDAVYATTGDSNIQTRIYLSY